MRSELIDARHLARLAIIYIRQSSPHQVLTNQESLRLQYDLRRRALMSDYDTDIALWSEHQAALLRRRATGQLVNDAALDWPNIAVGRKETIIRSRRDIRKLLKDRPEPATPPAADGGRRHRGRAGRHNTNPRPLWRTAVN